MTHLILHKVRGEPAFDIAEELEIGNEVGWIIPTSGHRAYPYQTWSLDELNINNPTTIPTDWPDHYECNDKPVSAGTVTSILSKFMPKMKDRRF